MYHRWTTACLLLYNSVIMIPKSKWWSQAISWVVHPYSFSMACQPIISKGIVEYPSDTRLTWEAKYIRCKKLKTLDIMHWEWNLPFAYPVFSQEGDRENVMQLLNRKLGLYLVWMHVSEENYYRFGGSFFQCPFPPNLPVETKRNCCFAQSHINYYITVTM